MSVMADTKQKVDTTSINFNIIAGQTTSQSISLYGMQLLALIVPPEVISVLNITFLASVDDRNFYILKNGYTNTPIALQGSFGSYLNVLPTDFCSCNYLKLVIDNTQAVNLTFRAVGGEVL